MEIGNSWDLHIGKEFEKPYYLALREFLKNEYGKNQIYPAMYDIFNALKATPYDDVKVVILGQDPYHGPDQAHGLSFSVQPGMAIPPSLMNIYKELHEDIGMMIPKTGYLLPWAKQGVLLLNTTLTVERGKPNSHRGQGWETFTDACISSLNDAKHPIIFLLWGSPARAKKKLITNPYHVVLETVHPSPLSAYNGFFGCKHFSKCNELLTFFGLEPIKWEAVLEDNSML